MKQITEIKQINSEIKRLKLKCDELEQHSRKQLIRITGLPETERENTDLKVLDLVRSLAVVMQPSDLLVSRHTGKKGPNRPLCYFCPDTKSEDKTFFPE